MYHYNLITTGVIAIIMFALRTDALPWEKYEEEFNSKMAPFIARVNHCLDNQQALSGYLDESLRENIHRFRNTDFYRASNNRESHLEFWEHLVKLINEEEGGPCAGTFNMKDFEIQKDRLYWPLVVRLGRDQLKKMRLENGNLTEALIAANAQISALPENVSALMRQNAAMSEELETLRRSEDTLRTENDSLNRERGALIEERNSLQQEKKVLQKKASIAVSCAVVAGVMLFISAVVTTILAKRWKVRIANQEQSDDVDEKADVAKDSFPQGEWQ